MRKETIFGRNFPFKDFNGAVALSSTRACLDERQYGKACSYAVVGTAPSPPEIRASSFIFCICSGALRSGTSSVKRSARRCAPKLAVSVSCAFRPHGCLNPVVT